MAKNNLTPDLACGIHTVNVMYEGQEDISEVMSNLPYIESERVSYSLNSNKYSFKFNPSKCINMSVYGLTAYKQAFEKLRKDLHTDKLKINRVDFRFDSFSDGDFDLYKKINGLLILMIAQEFNINSNTFDTKNKFTKKLLSIKADDLQRLEIENYDKSEELKNRHKFTKSLNEIEEGVTNRLEFREKKMGANTEGKPAGEVEVISLEKWFSRLDKALTPENYNKVCDRLNTGLLNEWRTETINTKASEYLKTNCINIYSRKQLIDFFTKAEYKSPVDTANQFRRKQKIDFYSLNDLKKYVDNLFEQAMVFIQN